MNFKNMSYTIACLTVLMMGSALQAMSVKKIKQSDLNEQLIEAAQNGTMQQMQELLAQGADLNAKSFDGRSALLSAFFSCKKEKWELLISKGADVNAATNDGYTPLMYAAQGPDCKEMSELLIAHKADVNAYTQNHTTALMLASLNGNETIGELLIAKGALLNRLDKDGMSALSLAASRGHLPVCEVLISKGAHIDAGDALIEAIANSRYEVCKLLIAKGANVHPQTNDGCSALAFVALAPNEEICKLIIQKMIKPTHEQLNSMKALLVSIKRRRIDLARLIGGSDVVQLVSQAPEKLMNEIRQQNKSFAETTINEIENKALKAELLQYLKTL